MNLKNILIVGLGSIGLKHLRIAREIFPDSRIAVLRHKETNEIPECADEVFFNLSQTLGELTKFDDCSQKETDFKILS